MSNTVKDIFVDLDKDKIPTDLTISNLSCWPLSAGYDVPFLYATETDLLCNIFLKLSGITEKKAYEVCYTNYKEIDKDELISLLMYRKTLIISSLIDTSEPFSENGYQMLMFNGKVAELRERTFTAVGMRAKEYVHNLGLQPFDSDDPSLLLSSIKTEQIEEEGALFETKISVPRSLSGDAEQDLSRIAYYLKSLPRKAKQRYKPTNKPKVIVKPQKRTHSLSDLLERLPSHSACFALSWMAPPPIFPADIVKLEEMDALEQTFLIDAFMDIYYTEALLNALYFLVRRNKTLWTRESSQIVDRAPYQNKEISTLTSLLDSVCEELFEKITVKFLALEGISLSADRLTRFFSQDSSLGQNIGEIIDEILCIIRDGALATARLRLSVLYGPIHLSYVGNEWMSAYLIFYGTTISDATACTNLESLLSAVTSLTLPADELTLRNSFEKNYSAERGKFSEPLKQREYSDTTDAGKRMRDEGNIPLRRTNLGSEGSIPPLQKSSVSPLLTILQDYWQAIEVL